MPQPDPVRRRRRRLRGTHAQRRLEPTQGAGARRLAQHFPRSPLPLRRRFRAGRPPAPQSGQEMARLFSEVDLLLVPSLRDEMLTITNFTGHPSLTLRAGFVEVAKARSDWAPRSRKTRCPHSPRHAAFPRRHSDRPPVRRRHARPSAASRWSTPSAWSTSGRRASRCFESLMGVASQPSPAADGLGQRPDRRPMAGLPPV